MRRRLLGWGRGLLMTGLGWGCVALAIAGQKIPVEDLPEKVRAAIRKQFEGSTPISAMRGDERNDYVYYSVILQDGKSRRSVTVTEFGEIIPAPH